MKIGVSLLLALLVLLSTTPWLSSSFASSSTANQSCSVVNIDNEIGQDKLQFAGQTAYSLAEQSEIFHEFSASSSLQPATISGIWHFDLVSCSVELTSVSVAFLMTNASGVNKVLYVEENPQLTQVLGATVQNPIIAGTSNSPSWSGYEYYASSGVNYVEGEWGVPSAQPPSGSTCSNSKCFVTIWTGASIGANGTNGLAQGGTGDSVICTVSNCSSYYTDYYAWYEFYGISCAPQPGCGISPAWNCTYYQGMTISVGDEIQNYVDYTPSNSTMNVYVNDLTNGNTCTNLIYTAKDGAVTMNQPYYGQFIMERPETSPTSGTYYSLPDFQSTTIYDAYVDSSQINSLTPSTTNIMVNSGHQNINLSSVGYNRNIGAYFDETWNTSLGT